GSCAVGKKCKKNSECAASVCNKGVCSTDRCGDGVTDADETDIDCGGANCGTRCAVGKGCLVNRDCASGSCGAKPTTKPYLSVAEQCADGQKDATEAGVDCGGKDCAKCALGVAVSSATDCASGFWNGSVCVASHCEDGLKTGNETDVDCGGADCKARCAFSRV